MATVNGEMQLIQEQVCRYKNNLSEKAIPLRQQERNIFIQKENNNRRANFEGSLERNLKSNHTRSPSLSEYV